MTAAIAVWLGLGLTLAVAVYLTLRLALVHALRGEGDVGRRVLRAVLVPWAATAEWRGGRRASVIAWGVFLGAYAVLQVVALALWGT